MAFKFPFTNYHELNLTWVLDQLKALFEKSEENVTTIETYDGRLSTVEAELPVVAETASEASRAADAAGTLAQTAKTTADTAQNNAIHAQGLAGTARQEAQAAQTAANEATQAAQQAQATVQDFDGRITQAEADASEALQEAQSFENRVNAAINTANNAANTATIAQGIAVNANQNAAAALDAAQIADGKAEAAQDAADIADGKADTNSATIGNLTDLTTIAKNNLVAAINEAAQSGGGGGSGVSSIVPFIFANYLPSAETAVTQYNRTITIKGNRVIKTQNGNSTNRVAFLYKSNKFLYGTSADAVFNQITLNDLITFPVGMYLRLQAIASVFNGSSSSNPNSEISIVEYDSNNKRISNTSFWINSDYNEKYLQINNPKVAILYWTPNSRYNSNFYWWPDITSYNPAELQALILEH